MKVTMVNFEFSLNLCNYNLIFVFDSGSAVLWQTFLHTYTHKLPLKKWIDIEDSAYDVRTKLMYHCHETGNVIPFLLLLTFCECSKFLQISFLKSSKQKIKTFNTPSILKNYSYKREWSEASQVSFNTTLFTTFKGTTKYMSTEI